MDTLDKMPVDVEIKPKFEERYKAMLGDKYDNFLNYSLSYINKSIRVNTLKADVEDIKKQLQKEWKLVPIPWCKEGFWIEHKGKERFDIGNLPQHQLGYLYIQEAASMIPPIVLEPMPGDKVLDMCAAPGSKTTQIAAMMQNTGVLIANDIQGTRLKALGINIQKCGVTNAILTKMPGYIFKQKQAKYDKVLVDAPCSGTGTIRTSLKTLRMWSPNIVRKLQGVQRQLIDSGFAALKPQGTLVYSTCTQEPEENEAVVSWLLEKYSDARVEQINLNINKSPAITSFEKQIYNKEVKKCLRIYPQDNNTEGFFIAKITKS
ncbi:NOL1/NOP2/sun family putative RNA methylase [Nanoarchaeota archaeon]